MRNREIHQVIEAYAAAAAAALESDRVAGAEVPFELADSARGPSGPALYCYRPLTRGFVAERREHLAALPAYEPAAEALTVLNGTVRYLEYCGVTPLPTQPRLRADLCLETLLVRIFAERSDFTLDTEHLHRCLEELEKALYEPQGVRTVLAPLVGLSLDPGSGEVALGDDLRLVRGEMLTDVPSEAVWGAPGVGMSREPNVLIVLRVPETHGETSPVALARSRFRRVLTALRLFERGTYALGSRGWMRSEGGTWREIALSSSGRGGLVTLLGADREAELAAFLELLSRRGAIAGLPQDDVVEVGEESRSGSGELAWALARFEMGCERLAPLEALSDYLLALRGLLEPEGPRSGRLSQRLAVLCAPRERRATLAERIAQTVSLEQAVIRGTSPTQAGVGTLVLELSEHLRALLRDVICGHLETELCGLADELLADDVTLAA